MASWCFTFCAPTPCREHKQGDTHCGGNLLAHTQFRLRPLDWSILTKRIFLLIYLYLRSNRINCSSQSSEWWRHLDELGLKEGYKQNCKLRKTQHNFKERAISPLWVAHCPRPLWAPWFSKNRTSMLSVSMAMQMLAVVVVLLVSLLAVPSLGSASPFCTSAESAGRYAGWRPSYTAARATDLHRVRFYLTPSNLDVLDVNEFPSPKLSRFHQRGGKRLKAFSRFPSRIRGCVFWIA